MVTLEKQTWQEALIKSCGHPLLWRVVLKLGEMTHLAYDAPKKVSASQVISAARAVLSEAEKISKIASTYTM